MPEDGGRSAPSPDVLRVELGARSYDVVVGPGLLEKAGAWLRPVLPSSRVVIVTDEIVAPLYLDALRAGLATDGFEHETVVLPSGEQTKDFAHFQSLCERILDGGIDRSTALVAIGGGVVGDIVGFAAGVLLRGLPFVQVPTTLLAQVDSSVGGKTGINTPQGKNLVGVFHQPRLVLADVATLASLDRRQLLAGYAEVVKYGLIGDRAFFSWLEEHGPRLCDGDGALLQRAVLTSCAAKAAVVAADERESGQRALLNLGHTFGHALEAEAGYGEALLHGEGVAIGMMLAFDVSVRLGLCHPDEATRLYDHLAAVGLPVSPRDVRLGDRQWSTSRLLHHMTRDKKVQGGQITFILVHAIGRAFIARDVPVEDVRRCLDDALVE